ncbi:hypothetical protein EXIGUO9Y_480003 [Exiguobacterium oxidotolerans]|uniref:Uncharacterized protein n=1 Tax=Exiguobacterium oxidotolerans TaxID=223958 RepID=A0A653IGY7_9BACL|nr:hypothetical protein EXIGUO9Y_480003 [Exiguobacterium oxidotolerans]
MNRYQKGRVGIGMGIKEQVYMHAPIFLQNVLTTLHGYHLQRERYGAFYL